MICTIVGQRGTGKSTALRALMRNAQRLFVIDTLAEHGANVRRLFIEDPAGLARYLKRRPARFKIGYAPAGREDLAAALVAAWELGRLLVVIDEVDNWSKAGWCPAPVLWCLRYGRHRKIHAAATARRPADLPRAWTAASDKWIAFRITERNDLDYLKGIFGDHVNRIRELPRFHCIYFDADAWTFWLCRVTPAGELMRVSGI